METELDRLTCIRQNQEDMAEMDAPLWLCQKNPKIPRRICIFHWLPSVFIKHDPTVQKKQLIYLEKRKKKYYKFWNYYNSDIWSDFSGNAVCPASRLSLQVMLIIGSKHKLKIRFGLQTAQLVQIEQVFDFGQVCLQSHTWRGKNKLVTISEVFKSFKFCFYLS